ncbi:ABC transporter permease [Hyalangium rubrum]|uniref:ABC transporter permease n=1 Tax=Hyalangium rubrum TaxID=3103134 RepID=A0ABU5HJZ9_9BACT|nr:ABC transporter permease [Hyalangium sp. s54d21]MDY7233142.1 ABC transporter permease [Hyalangium sp. s54d21]
MKPSPMRLLFLLRVRSLLREPWALFWTFGLPLLLSLSLGFAFRDKAPSVLSVAVTDGLDAEGITARLDASPDLSAERLPPAEAMKALKQGRVMLVVEPGPPLRLNVDPLQQDGRIARLATLNVLERSPGGAEQVVVKDSPREGTGRRYVDFLIPGVVGFALMSSAIWGVGSVLVQLRTGKMLKRMVATPMKRGSFLFSFLVWRGALGLVEILVLLGFARLVFGVRVSGGVLAFTAFGLLGAVCLAGVAVLVASRARNLETANGVMSVTSMSMGLLSGVFFSVSHFPAWLQGLVQWLPLNALNHGLRGILLDGAGLLSLGKDLLVLGAWGLASFLAARRTFLWT